MDSTTRTVLVTGCSTGIGHAIVRLLAEKGFHVFAGVRHQRAIDELKRIHERITPLILDVTSDDDAAHAVEAIRVARPQGLYALVNNAGVALPAAVELTTLDELRELLEVNTVGPLRMIQSCLPMLRQVKIGRGHGRIVNISSMNGTMALPMVGAYSASKFALEALCDTLRVELRPWRIQVSLIRPGQVRTVIFDKSRKAIAERIASMPADLRPGYEKMYETADQFNERGAQSGTLPEHVAKRVLHALTSSWPRTHYHVGLDAFGMNLGKHYIPARLVDRALARVMKMFRPLD
jgi:NAD(P)-dependent dehydrogenase (short-subunit alcohol dehydrogenase family)